MGAQEDWPPAVLGRVTPSDPHPGGQRQAQIPPADSGSRTVPCRRRKWHWLIDREQGGFKRGCREPLVPGTGRVEAV